MRTKKTLAVPSMEDGPSSMTVGQRLRLVAARRAEEILAEVAPTLRRFRTFLLVATIAMPLFLVGLLAVLWHMAH